MEYHFIDRPLVGVLRKGKEHYFCSFRYFDFVNGIKQAPTKYETMLEFFAEKKFDKTAFDLDRIKMPGSVKGRICVKGNCGNCENAKDCRYKSFVDKAMDSRYHIDFQVTNHNLYLMSTQHKGLLKNSNLVIVDEAHKFKEAAQQAFGESISESTIKKYLNWTKTKCKFRYSSITYGAERAESYASLESKVWRNCIYKQSSTETDKYTKNGYGLYYSDFNDALSNFYVGESLTYSAVASNVTIVDGYMSELKDCPKKFENEYKALKELYIAYSDITDLVVGNSSYSWNTFNETLESAKSDYKSALSSAKLLLE